jgi:glyoxylase-like metal-dependent hydrolase (beta-lactamase superfamily II)
MTSSAHSPVADIQQSPVLQYYVLDTGYCLASEHHLIWGGRRRTVHCHALAVLLHHPEHGWFLWDTGYAPRMLDETRRLPWSLYRRATPLRLESSQPAVAQLHRWNLTADDIGHIVISHFHADHVAGLKDFPSAKLVVHHLAYADIAARRGFGAVRRAYIPALIPADFHERAHLLPHFTGPSLPDLGTTFDLWGDESVVLVELPGHARGQIGMLARTVDGPVLFAADACWLRRSILENRAPAPITDLFVDDARALRHTLARLHEFATMRPDTRIVPTHCPDTYAELFGRPA